MTSLPRYWRQQATPSGGTRLVYAVRGGAALWVLLALALMLFAASIASARWLGWGADLTVAGWLLFILLPGGAALAGVYVLDVLFWRQTQYTLDEGTIDVRVRSLFHGHGTQIARAMVTGVEQAYTPPAQDAATGDPGTWAVLVNYRAIKGHAASLALVGMGSEEESEWLGPLLAQWAKAPLARGFGASVADEANPAELPRSAKLRK